jgi:hypothetical protein
MARGYIGPTRPSFCRCCVSGPKSKFVCEKCLHVCKAPHGGAPHCPHCRIVMRDMGDKWRPAPRRQRTLPELLPYQRGFPSPGEALLEKIMKAQREGA